MKSSKDINLDIYNLSLITAKEDVLNPRTSTNWALFAYDGVTNRLKLADSGAGGVSELVDKLHPRRPLYGLCRVDQPKMTRTHIAMIIWVGKEVDDYRRAQCVAHVPAIKSFFKEAHFFLPASSLEDVTEERIFSVASTVTAMTDRDKARRVVRKEDREEKVGTNYKRTIAAAEIHKTLRENFWAQAEREEEARKDEERRRAAEDRRRRERERVQQERREAEERERRMNEKLKKIQDQRRIQAEADAEKLKQEQLKWAQQQKEFEDEMKSRFSHSESVEKAVEAAVLVSQRKQNPREFFRQLSLSSSNDPHPNPPSPSPTVRSSNRRIHRSLTDVILFTKSSSSSPSSPGSPKPLSPFFPSSPTSHSPTPLSQPQHTHSSPTTIPPYIPAYIPTKSPAVDSPSPPSRHTGVFTSDPCDTMEVFSSPPRDLKMVSPLPTSGPRDVFPPTSSGPREVFPPPPSGPREVFLSNPSGPREVLPLPHSGPRDVFPPPPSSPSDVFPPPSTGQEAVFPPCPSGPREVFPPPFSGPREVLPLPPSGPREVFPIPPPSGPKDVFPAHSSGPRDVFPQPPSGPREVFPLPPPSGPKDVFPAPSSGPREVFLLPPPSGPRDVFPPPPIGPREVFPPPPSGPRDVLPPPPSGPREVLPPPFSGPREAISSPPRGQKVISPLPPSGQTAMSTSPSNPIEFFPPHTGDLTVGSLPSPQGQKVVSLLHDSGSMEVFKSHTINQTVPTPAAPSTTSSNSLQPCSPENPNISLTELVEGLTFYPPLPAADITTQSLVQPETENLVPPQAQSTSPAAQNSVCDLDLTNTQCASPDQVQPDMPSATVSFPMISSAQPVPRPPSRPLPALPVREFCSLEAMISTEEDAERNDGEVTGEKEPWVTAQASMISIPEEEDDDVDKRELEEEKQLRVGKDRDVRETEIVMGQEEEKQDKMHEEKDEEMFSLAENVESQMVEERDEGIIVVEEENLEKTENNPEYWIATQVSIISIPQKESVDVEEKEENKDSEEVPQKVRELTQKKDDGKEEKGQEGMMGQEEEKLEEVHGEKDGEIFSPCKEKNKDMTNAENLESKLVGERDEGIKEEEQKLEIKKTNPKQWIATQPSMISIPKEESVGGQAKNENKDPKENEAGKENKDNEIQNERKERDEDTPEDPKEATEKKDDGNVGEVQMGVKETKEVKQVMVQSEDKEMVPSSEVENEDTEANNVESKVVGERDEGMKEEEEKLEMTKNDPEHWIASQASIISIPKEKSVDGEAKFENKDLKEDEVVREKKDSDIPNERKERDEEAPQEGRELTEKTDDGKVGKRQEGMMEQEEKAQEKVHGEKDEQILLPLEETSESMEGEILERKMVGERNEGMKEEEEKLEKTENDPKHWIASQVSMISIPKEESVAGESTDENKEQKENEAGLKKEASNILNIEKKDDGKVGKEQTEVMEQEEKTQEEVHGEKDEQILLPLEETSKSMEGEENLDNKIVEKRNEGMKEEEEKLEKTENNPENWIAAQMSLTSIPKKESIDEAGKKRDEEAVKGLEKGKEQEEQTESLWDQEKLVNERVADVEKVNEEEEDGTMGEGLIDRGTEVGKDAETDMEGTAKDAVENEIKNEEKEAELVEGEDDINGQTLDMDWREKNRVDAVLEKVVYEVKNTEPTEEERSERDTNEDGQMVEAKVSLDEGEEAERNENKVESKRKSESFGNWENNKIAREFEEFEKSPEPEMNQEATASEQEHRDEVKTVEILKDDTVDEREHGEQNDKVAQTDVLEKHDEIAEHTSPCGHSQTAQELAENPMQSEILTSGKCLTTEVGSNPSVSDDQPDSLSAGLAENLVATILESLATSIESSVTEATVFEQTFPASPSENSREFEDSSVDEACEEAKEMEEVESEGESAEDESEIDELDCEPAEWHTAELKTRHISTDSIKQLGPEDVGDELEDTDCATSTDTNQLTSSSGLDSVQELSYVDDGQEAFTLSAVDNASYEEAQEPDYDSDSVEEATEHAFLPAIDVNLKVMDTVTVSDTENKIKDK